MNKSKYLKVRNKVAFKCYLIVNSVLSIAYFIEVLRNLMSVKYFLSVLIVLWIPTLITFCILCKTKFISNYNKYFIVGMFCITYTYILLTTHNEITYTYAFPLLCTLLIYNDITLINLVSGYVLLLNFYCIYNNDITVPGDYFTYCAIRMLCIIIAYLMLLTLNNVFNYINQTISDLTDSVERDYLTNTYNRNYLHRRFMHIHHLELANITLAIIDIDFFKKINDTYGHMMGDKILQHLSNIFLENTSDFNDTDVVRIGGDEFIIISRELSDTAIAKLCDNISADVSGSNLICDQGIVSLSVSIGICNSTVNHCISYEELYRCADQALYSVKHKGRGAVAIYNKGGM